MLHATQTKNDIEQTSVVKRVKQILDLTDM